MIRFTSSIAILAGLFSSPSLSATEYDSVKEHMDQLVQNNPGIVEHVILGSNSRNQSIYGIKIHQSNGSITTKQLVVGAHHGNEQLSTTVALSFADQITEIMKTGKASIHGFEGMEFHVFPVLNIPGYNSGRREEPNRSGYNMDPNRDYPDPCGNDSFGLASTKALADYVDAEEVIGAVTIHGYIGTFTFPWGTYTSQTSSPDDQVYNEVSREVAKVNRYAVGTHADVIYPTVGAFEDWAYHSLGVWTALLEIKRNPNVARDAESLVKYFSEIPRLRSEFHDHLGNCRNLPEFIRARP
jgi:hypothetical protein